MAAGFICREIVAHAHDGRALATVIQGLFYSAIPVFTIPLYIFLFRLLAVRRNVVVGWLHPSLYYIVMNCFNTAIITCLAQGSATYYNPDAKEGPVSSGLALIKASLILQLALNFMFLGVLYFSQVWRNATERMTILLPFSALMGFVIVRNVFRTVQIFVSPLSPLWTQEVYFWLFDACMTAAYTVLFHVMHPAKHLDSEGGACGTSIGRRES